MIIDCHMHLGDILHIGGGKAISSDVSWYNKFNIQWIEENVLHFKSNAFSRILFKLLDDKYTESVQQRILSGTYKNFLNYKKYLENKSNELFSNKSVYFACMPVAPYVTFEDIIEFSNIDHTILPFTSIDPTLPIIEACDTVESQMEQAFGLKLHPIIQGVPFNSRRTLEVLEAIEKYNKPVLFHAGGSRYYLGDEKKYQHLELDDIKAARLMVKTFPGIKFIVGHAGCAESLEWASELSCFDNVFVDVTVQSGKSIANLVDIYGEDRVLFATDWPCINPKVTLEIVLKALSWIQKEKCLYKNSLLLFDIGK